MYGSDPCPRTDWAHELSDQLDWHWRQRLRPRLVGLTDEEYFWEPVADCWTVRPRRSEDEMGGGRFTVDYTFPTPAIAPVTTIAWRMAHLTVHVLARRTEMYFGGPSIDYDDRVYAGAAATALDQLDRAYDNWSSGMREATTAELDRTLGPSSGPFAGRPLAALVLHVNREMMHHGAEIALLRDLYLRLPQA
ncbi:DinB family protein [Streptomyces sp. NPDC090442]|uniref:DinB family protein n=1 Tax=Streptomyces sp. NPDC090442 TaxID=3365962 RepID=UPI0037FB7549